MTSTAVALTKIAQDAANSSTTKAAPSQQEIEARAYELFMERGQEPGHDVEDWLQAERELATNGAGRTA